MISNLFSFCFNLCLNDKADLETDLALSRHVLHVHKYLRKPDANFTPLKPSAVKQYIAAARTVREKNIVVLNQINEAFMLTADYARNSS